MALSPVADLSPAQWVVDSLKTFGSDVGGLVPDPFEAYARVFHPAWIGREDGRPVSWREIATVNNKSAHPEMQFRALVPPGSIDQAGNMRGCQPDIWTSPPSDGEITDEIASELARVLSNFTSTPNECYFAYWEGWGDPSPMVAVKPGPFWRLRHRWAVTRGCAGVRLRGDAARRSGRGGPFQDTGTRLLPIPWGNLRGDHRLGWNGRVTADDVVAGRSRVVRAHRDRSRLDLRRSIPALHRRPTRHLGVRST